MQRTRPWEVQVLQEVMLDPKARESSHVNVADFLLQLTSATIATVEELELRVQRVTRQQQPSNGEINATSKRRERSSRGSTNQLREFSPASSWGL